jgi:hypothetical protein
MIKKRNLPGQVGLMIINFGIYAIYWFYKISEEMKFVGKDFCFSFPLQISGRAISSQSFMRRSPQIILINGFYLFCGWSSRRQFGI